MLMKGLRADPTAPLPKRLDSLTSLRFFAAFAVFAHHFTGLGGKTGFGRSETIFPFSGIGAHGVTFFFVLSGFLMMWVFKPRESPLVFYWRRVGRIWPVHLVALPLGIYAFYIAAKVDIDWPGLISSVFLVQTWFPDVTPTLPGNPVTWTLSVELLFYALFPLVAPFANRMRTRWLMVATAVGLFGMYLVNWVADANLEPAMARWVMRHPLVYLPEFLLGMTMALALRRGWRLPLHPVVPLAGLFGWTYLYYQERWPFSDVVEHQMEFAMRPVVGILSALIILAFLQREARGHRGVLNNRLLVSLGLWSYSFYLVHHAISRLATYEFGRMPDNDSVLFTLIGMAVVINVICWVLFTYVEEPAEKWWRKHTPKRWLDRGGETGGSVLPPAPRREAETAPASV
ncbi:peptidoglycan/LPS O-acetylase OafA/YrhL [Actinoplanes campanulatus]|uniref:Peptidoglycan/LPS O-acetylase OafA/YrhL n=2 Tax=Actinoplanes campanulatus TaxID=113559 RepID=A0A7W5AJV0_9ACTN|nr:peptidoglycan/LPS O-acetylase OafA/YrhL [Actinoplanes campanulatus]GGN16664.1 acyltransferase [Actinoplanes campanulatus]GID37583.1 acyltransferase [Actinoplanes campanulatus]